MVDMALTDKSSDQTLPACHQRQIYRNVNWRFFYIDTDRVDEL